MSPKRRANAAAVVVAALLATTGTVRAHVDYVVEDGESADALAFLVRTLTDPLNAALVGTAGAGTVAAALVYLRVRPARRDVDVLREALASYADLVPWLLRLSVGLPLVGAGFLGYYFSPAVTEPAAFGLPFGGVVLRLFGVTVGFLLLFGLATRIVAAVALASYLIGLAFEPELLLAFEFVPGFLAIVLVGAGRPSADHVLARLAATEGTLYARIDPVYAALAVPFERAVEPYRSLVPTIVRVGLGFAFVYLGLVQKLMSPGEALAVVEKYALTTVVPVDAALWVVGAGLAEIAVGLAILVGAFTRAAAGVAFLLFTLTLFGLPDDPVLAHVSLFGLVSALLVTGAGPFAVDDALGTRAADADRAVPGTTD